MGLFFASLKPFSFLSVPSSTHLGIFSFLDQLGLDGNQLEWLAALGITWELSGSENKLFFCSYLES